MPRPKKLLMMNGGTTTEVDVPEPSTEERPSKLNRADRPKRVPINGYRAVLDVQGKEDGWHYCWINDDQVDRFLAGGYEFVTHAVIIGDRKIDASTQMGTKISKSVGNGMTGYLMRIEEDLFDEDQESIQKEIWEKEQAMRENLNSKSDGRYGEVKITQRRGE